MKEKVLEKVTSKTKIILIDGRCASGKTTLADDIAKEIKGQVIHMDDFFLPIELRTKERLDEPGGNVHYERFLKEVVEPLKRGENLEYRVFSCKEMDYVSTKRVDISKPIIIEGAYALHPIFKWHEANDIVTVFKDIDSKTQLDRIEKRNGPLVMEIFKEKWIPLENKYLDAFGIEEQCEVKI